MSMVGTGETKQRQSLYLMLLYIQGSNDVIQRNLNVAKPFPSIHPVSQVEKLSKHLGGNIGCECFNNWRGRGYDDSVPGEVTKTTPYGDRAT